MAAPTYVGKQSTVFNTDTTPKTTATLTCDSGDLLIAKAAYETHLGSISISSSPSLTWTLQQSISVNEYCYTALWTAVATGNTTVTFTASGGAGLYFGGTVTNYRNSDGLGASSKTNNTGAPSLNITTTQADSAIEVIVGDWNAVTGTVTARTNAGTFTQVDDYADGAHYALHTGYHANAGAIGTYAVGYTAPTGQKYAIIAIEIKGTAGAAVTSLPDGNIRRFYSNLLGL